jgi:hypothetical protein
MGNNETMAVTEQKKHTWKFSRVGGFDQVTLEPGQISSAGTAQPETVGCPQLPHQRVGI